MATLLGWQNIVYEPDVTFAVYGVTSILPPSNLATLTGAPSTAWRAPLQQSGQWPLLRFVPSSRRIFGAMGFFRTNLTSAAQVTFQVYTNLASPSLRYNGVAFPGRQGQVLAFPANIAGDFCQCQFQDPNNPDGFINIPLSYAGPVFTPATPASWATTHGRDDGSEILTTRGGTRYVTVKWQRRRLELALDGLRQAEVWPQVDVLRRTARTGTNVLAVPDTTGSVQEESVFGLLSDTSDITYPQGNNDRRQWHARITERL